MMRVLILFTRESIEKSQAYPVRLKSLLEANGNDLTVDTATYDDLSYVLTSTSSTITVATSGLDISEYDLVYLRRIKEGIAQAIAVGKYCLAKGVPVMDSEIAARPGSMGKLTQYLQLSIAGLPFPDTVYSSSPDLLLQTFERSDLEFPVIVKAVGGSRGSDNHLIDSHEALQQLLADFPSIHFVIQKFIPNSSDYRVWVCGDATGPVLFRTRGSGHLNNTSQGGEATLLEGTTVLPAPVLADCIRAAQLFQRDLAGVDVVFENDDLHGRYYFFEVNRAPQIEDTPYEDVKARALAEYMTQRIQQGHKGGSHE